MRRTKILQGCLFDDKQPIVNIIDIKYIKKIKPSFNGYYKLVIEFTNDFDKELADKLKYADKVEFIDE